MAKCGQCINLDWKNKERWTSEERYYCKEGHGYRRPTDYECSYDFIENKAKKASDDGYTHAGCYITTIVCHILGYEDDCELLETLRNFRENTLRGNLQYLNILLQYDIIGPKISTAIKEIPESYGFCLNLMNNFLLPCAHAIKKEQTEEAVMIYQNMVMYLMEILEIPSIQIPDNLEYDPINVGKGRLLKSTI